jgi:hypothetical protein
VNKHPCFRVFGIFEHTRHECICGFARVRARSFYVPPSV